jgi:hypothetical protein
MKLCAICVISNDPDRHRYGGDVPVPDYPQAVADYYQKRFGVTLDPKTESLRQLVPKTASLMCRGPSLMRAMWHWCRSRVIRFTTSERSSRAAKAL